MAIFKARNGNYWFDGALGGRRVCFSTGTRNKAVASKIVRAKLASSVWRRPSALPLHLSGDLEVDLDSAGSDAVPARKRRVRRV